MEDIDREIKKIQLQRERLALDRELAPSKASVVARVVTGSLIALFRLLGRFFIRWGKTMLLLVLITAAVAGAIFWKEKNDTMKREAITAVRLTRWTLDRTVFLNKECPANNSSCRLTKLDDLDGCARTDLALLLCRDKASENYQRRVPFND